MVHNCGQSGRPDPAKQIPGQDNLYEGQQREGLRQQGYQRTRNVIRDNDSQPFRDFVEQRNGAPFDDNQWKYHMETWERGGVPVENHYWQGTFDDDPFIDVFFHHHG